MSKTMLNLTSQDVNHFLKEILIGLSTKTVSAREAKETNNACGKAINLAHKELEAQIARAKYGNKIKIPPLLEI